MVGGRRRRVPSLRIAARQCRLHGGDEQPGPASRHRAHSGGCGLSALAVKERLPAVLPVATRIRHESLALRFWWRDTHGPPARFLVSGLLRWADDAAVRCWRHEHWLDGGTGAG